MQRKWTVPAYIDSDPAIALANFDREEAANAFLEAEAFVYRLGGNVFVTAHRVPVGDDYQTAGVVILYDSFQRNQRREQPAPVAEPELATGDANGAVAEPAPAAG